MIESTILKIKQPENDNLGSTFLSLLEFLENANGLLNAKRVTIDLSHIRFAFPLLILPISGLIKEITANGIDVKCILNDNCYEYFNAIKFPYGFSANSQANFAKNLNHYRFKTYLPICSIPTGINEMSHRDEILSAFDSILQVQLEIKGQLKSAISYLISEVFDNIVEHADVPLGWIMVQNYPKKEFLDVCILDTGNGILGTYTKASIKGISTDEQAIQEAINGLSTKTKEMYRGFGLKTSRKMLVRGLGGKFLLFSGNAFYVYTSEQETINVLDTKYRWNGTIVALRIPKEPPEKFNYLNFVE